MKLITLFSILTFSINSLAFDNLHCRKVSDLRQIVKLQGDTLIASIDEYEDWETPISKRTKVKVGEDTISAYGLEFNLEVSVNTTLPDSNIDGNSAVLFKADLVKGLIKSFQGEYVCIKNGYLALTIQGDEPDGGYSISVNY